MNVIVFESLFSLLNSLVINIRSQIELGTLILCVLCCVFLQDNLWRLDTPKASLLQFVRGKRVHSRHLFDLRESALNCCDSFVLDLSVSSWGNNFCLQKVSIYSNKIGDHTREKIRTFGYSWFFPCFKLQFLDRSDLLVNQLDFI